MESGHRVLITDDDPMNVRVFVELLQGDYRLSIARSGDEALDLLAQGQLPDLILLDIMMPGMSGYEVCELIKSDARWNSIPIIFVTALNESVDETRGFTVGAVDYVQKPVIPAVLLARIKTHIELKRAEEILRRHNEELESLVQERTHEVTLTQDIMMKTLSHLSELQQGGSEETRRIQHGVIALARAVQNHPGFAEAMTPQYLDRLFRSVPMQNIGMVGLPPEIVRKKTALSAEEQIVYQTHPVLGREALLASLASEASDSLDFLQIAVDLIGAHHENWDGSGYPDGLKGESIPMSARLLHVVNCYNEALQAAQPGEDAHERAIERIRESSGKRLDPRLVSAFLSVSEEFKLISKHYPDRY